MPIIETIILSVIASAAITAPIADHAIKRHQGDSYTSFSERFVRLFRYKYLHENVEAGINEFIGEVLDHTDGWDETERPVEGADQPDGCIETPVVPETQELACVVRRPSVMLSDGSVLRFRSPRLPAEEQGSSSSDITVAEESTNVLDDFVLCNKGPRALSNQRHLTRYRKTAITTIMVAKARNKFYIKDGSYGEADFICIRKYLLREMESVGMRPTHIAELLEIMVELCFIPSEAQFQASELKHSREAQRRVEELASPYYTQWFSSFFRILPQRITRKVVVSG
jgi:hypothetical protein